MKVACIQMNSQECVSDNLQAMHSWLEKVKDADYVFFPETVDYCGKDPKNHAQTLPGEITEKFSQWAKDYHIYLYAGSIIEAQADRPKNTSLFYNPRGRLIGKYAKTHLFELELENTSFMESQNMQSGDAYSVVYTKDASFGMSICYDVRFPKMYQKMTEAGAEILVVVANFTKPTGKAHWQTLLQARAIENACFVIAVDQVGTKTELGFDAYGHTMVIDPWGRVLASIEEDKEACLMVDLDLSLISKVRTQIPILKNEREELEEHAFHE